MLGKPLSIALLGTRGIPARYGGFETFAEEISTRLAGRGHAVTVFCREIAGVAREKPRSYKGVNLLYSTTIGHKYLETPLHALTSNLLLLRHRFDVALLCNAANSPFAWMIKLLGIPLAINVDGIERERAKWNALGRAWYRLGEKSSVLFADKVIGDAKVICDYYRETYRCDSQMIPYGAHADRREAGTALTEFGLESGRYVLYVSRLEPENNALGVIQAYKRSSRKVPLVIVGDAPYADDYKASLQREAEGAKDIIFTGFQFGDAYKEFQSNCLLYIQATEVGGTHPALIEAMAYGNCIIANGTPENREVLGEAGLIYEKNCFDELGELISRACADEDLMKSFRSKSAARAADLYSWESVTESYEKLFYSLAGA